MISDVESKPLLAPPMGTDYSLPSQAAPPPASAPPPPPTMTNYYQNVPQSQLSVKSGESSRKQNSSSSTRSRTSSSRQKHGSKREKIKSAIKQQIQDLGPQKNCCHILFDFVRYLTILTSSIKLAMQSVPLLMLRTDMTWLQLAVRSYLAIFYVIFILIESHLVRGLSHSNWILHGFLYTFIAFIGMEEDLVEDIADGSSDVFGPNISKLFAMLFVSITSWIMVFVGILYTILGLLCLQKWYEKMEDQHNEKRKEWRLQKKQEKELHRQQIQKEYGTDLTGGDWYDDVA